MNANELIEETYRHVLARLPESIRSQLARQRVPTPLDRPGCEFLKLAIWAKEKADFWCLKWCAYEIGVGPFYAKRAGSGGVGFYCYPYNSDCGNGRYFTAAAGTLRDAAAKSCHNFELTLNERSFSIFRHYPKAKFPSFAPDQAAEDLAWLIQQTLPRFVAMTQSAVPPSAPERAPSQAVQHSHARTVAVTESAAAATAPVESDKRQRLVRMLQQLTPSQRAKLEEQKRGQEGLERPDFLWYFLLQSFATMGNSRGWKGLIGTPANYNRIRYDALRKLPPTDRAQLIERVCLDAGIRMPRKKAGWLTENFERIEQMGGLAAAKAQALAASGMEGKIEFLQQFSGIGEKYGRNIWMDVYHPDFRSAVAIDERIKSISTALGYSFKNYREHEQFYLDIAAEAGLDGWELDRLLYNFKDTFLAGLRS